MLKKVSKVVIDLWTSMNPYGHTKIRTCMHNLSHSVYE